MGHDAHFLTRLDRITAEETDLALALYRDPELVHDLIVLATSAGKEECFGIALTDDPEPPYAVVMRNGRFVTCLAKGMKLKDAWPVPKVDIDKVLAIRSDLQERLTVARKIARTGESSADLFRRVDTRKNQLGREELAAAAVLAPLLAHDLYIQATTAAVEIYRASQRWHRERLAPAERRAVVEGRSRRIWAVAHRLELCGMAGEPPLRHMIARLAENKPVTMSSSFLVLVDTTFLLRAAWMASVLGTSLVASYAHALSTTDNRMEALDGAVGLTVLALRHAGAEAEIRAILQEVERSQPSSVVGRMRMRLAQRALGVLDKRTELGLRAREEGAKVYFGLSRGLEQGHPLRIAHPLDCPVHLAETARLSMPGNPLQTNGAIDWFFEALPIVAEVSAEAFHFPLAVVSKLVPPWGDAEYNRAIALIELVHQQPKPVVKAVKVGRNEPCPCGSGKKAKRCCEE